MPDITLQPPAYRSLALVPWGKGLWKVLHPWVYRGARITIEVPAGFLTDLASIPWPASLLIPRNDPVHAAAAVAHDWLYSQQPISRKDADNLFHSILVDDGERVTRSFLMWIGLRIGGWIAWRGHRRRNIKRLHRMEAATRLRRQT